MPQGIVKFYDPAKHFGFIARDDGERDVYVHVSAVEKSDIDDLKEGDKLTFDLEQHDRGPRAVNLAKV